ncbi:MAG: LysR family transcriptional regulator [Pseudomonadota bacterium]
MLDLRHVDSFVAVADTRSFTEAANRKNTVQSAISTHIRMLEADIGRKLVERGRGKSVALTAEGSAFLVHARRLLGFAEDLKRGASAAVERPVVRLGTTSTFALSVVPKILARLAEYGFEHDVSVAVARSHELRDRLQDGSFDLVLVMDQGPHPWRMDTVSVPLAWAAAAHVAFDRTGAVPLVFLEDARDLRRHALNALDASGAPVGPLRVCPDAIGMRATVLSGLAATVMPACAVIPPLKDLGPELNLPALRRVPVSTYACADPSPAVSIVAAECVQAIQSL